MTHAPSRDGKPVFEASWNQEEHAVAQRVQAALERLGRDQREAIRLRYLHHLRFADAAAKMGLSEDTVRSLCVRGLIRLHGMLEDLV